MKKYKAKLLNAECGIKIQNPKSKIEILGNERGIALALVLVLSVIALGVMTALIYMLTSGSQISGVQKRYRSAAEAGKGGTDIIFQTIAARGNLSLTTSASFQNLSTFADPCLTDKLTKATANWNAACDKSVTINPATTTTYDMKFDIGTDPVYTVYTKIVDTVEGNSAPDTGLQKSGVVSTNTGEVTVKSVPYLYTIEVDAGNASNPTERSKLSVLYQY